jgi:hypothetical protein
MYRTIYRIALFLPLCTYLFALHAAAAEPLRRHGTAESSQPVYLGDVNADRVVDVADAWALLELVAGRGGDGVRCEEAADANADGMLDARDAAVVLKLALEEGPGLLRREQAVCTDTAGSFIQETPLQGFPGQGDGIVTELPPNLRVSFFLEGGVSDVTLSGTVSATCSNLDGFD